MTLLRLAVLAGSVFFLWRQVCGTETGQIGFSQYTLVKGSLSWHEAKADAEARGGHLATITSETEWNGVKALFGDELLGAFRGASDEEQEGTWKWVTGEPFIF